MLITTVLAAALAAPSILVLTTGQRLEVDSYKVDGAVVRFVDAKGEPGIMRVTMIDFEASEAATANKLVADEAAAAKAERDAIAAAEADEQTRIAREQADAKQRARTGNAAPGLSTSAVSVSKATSPSSAPTGSSGGNATVKKEAAGDLEALRSQWRAAQDRAAQAVREHDALVDRHNSSSNYAERDTDRTQMAILRDEMQRLKNEAAALESQYKAAQEAARRAGVNARERNQAIGGGAEVAK